MIKIPGLGKFFKAVRGRLHTETLEDKIEALNAAIAQDDLDNMEGLCGELVRDHRHSMEIEQPVLKALFKLKEERPKTALNIALSGTSRGFHTPPNYRPTSRDFEDSLLFVADKIVLEDPSISDLSLVKVLDHNPETVALIIERKANKDLPGTIQYLEMTHQMYNSRDPGKELVASHIETLKERAAESAASFDAE